MAIDPEVQAALEALQAQITTLESTVTTHRQQAVASLQTLNTRMTNTGDDLATQANRVDFIILTLRRIREALRSGRINDEDDTTILSVISELLGQQPEELRETLRWLTEQRRQSRSR